MSANEHRLPIQTLLLVDDSHEEVFLTGRFLKRDKIRIELLAFDNVEQFEQHANSTPQFNPSQSLLIADLYLMLGQSTEAFPELVKRYPELPLGICTGSEDPQHKSQALVAGAWFFVNKPLDGTCLSTICSQVPRLHYEKTAGEQVQLYHDTTL